VQTQSMLRLQGCSYEDIADMRLCLHMSLLRSKCKCTVVDQHILDWPSSAHKDPIGRHLIILFPNLIQIESLKMKFVTLTLYDDVSCIYRHFTQSPLIEIEFFDKADM
jgi:hypothetical protein